MNENLKPDEVTMLERAEKATKGPWRAWIPKRSEITAHQRYTISRVDNGYSHPDMEAVVASCYGDGGNAAFIAAARTDLPTVLARLATLRAKLAIAMEAMKECDDLYLGSTDNPVTRAFRRINELEKQS